MTKLRFNCPSCQTKLAPVEAMDDATQVVRRRCRKCGERWQLVVTKLVDRGGVRLDQATFAFLGR